jgi:hypothetical protein
MYLYVLSVVNYQTELADYSDMYAIGGYCAASSEMSTQTASLSIFNVFMS